MENERERGFDVEAGSVGVDQADRGLLRARAGGTEGPGLADLESGIG